MEENITNRIEMAIHCATLTDLRTAKQITEYIGAHCPDLTAPEILAICIRYGVRSGKAGAENRAKAAYAQIKALRQEAHQDPGTDPRQDPPQEAPKDVDSDGITEV